MSEMFGIYRQVSNWVWVENWVFSTKKVEKSSFDPLPTCSRCMAGVHRPFYVIKTYEPCSRRMEHTQGACHVLKAP